VLSAGVLLGAQVAFAQVPQRYAVVVSGANGEASYAEEYAQWRDALVTALKDKFAFD